MSGTTFRDVWAYAQNVVDRENRKTSINEVLTEYPLVLDIRKSAHIDKAEKNGA